MTEQIILVILGILIGSIAAWFIARSKAVEKVNSEINTRIRLEVDLKNVQARNTELQAECREMANTREQYAAINAKHDKIRLDFIELTNEKNRLKSQLEEYRRNEMKLTNLNAALAGEI